jgi:hypothetical protein
MMGPVSADIPRSARVARIHVDLTEREARSLVRAATLVADVLRPELFARNGSASTSPLVTAYQVLIASCERAGVDLGMPLGVTDTTVDALPPD